MLLSQAVKGFLLDRDGDRQDDLSPATLTLYRKLLNQFVRYLDDPPIEHVKAANLDQWMAYLEREYTTETGSQLSGPSRDNHWKAVRSLFGWAEKVLQISRPDLQMTRPAYAREEIVPFSETDARKILAALEYSQVPAKDGRRAYRTRRPTATRDRAIVLLMLETGMRLGELSRLRMVDVDLEAGEVVIRPYRTGKKSKARIIPIEKGCKRALWLYANKERIDALPGEKFFPMAYHSVQSLLHRLTQKTGIDIHAHRFRHTFAIQYLRNGGDIFTLQKILGHSSLEMVRRYLAIAQSDVKDAHRRASPVDRWKL